MPIEKIKSLLKDEPINEKDVFTIIKDMDNFSIARRLNEFSTKDKVRIFHLLNSDYKRQVLLYETDMDSRMEIQENLDKDAAKAVDSKWMSQVLNKCHVESPVYSRCGRGFE